jgi:hypothetical protein
MRQYGVTVDEVCAVLSTYDSAVPARKGCINLYKIMNAKRYRLTVKPTRDRESGRPDALVITVHVRDAG